MNLEAIVISAAIVAMLLLVYGGYYFYLYPKLACRFEYAALSRFQVFLKNLKSPYNEYSYFTDSHLVWTETDIPGILQLIHKGCRVHAPEIGVAATPARFLLHEDESKKCVYIVFTRAKTFDWGSIPHYEEHISGHSNSGPRGGVSEAQ